MQNKINFYDYIGDQVDRNFVIRSLSLSAYALHLHTHTLVNVNGFTYGYYINRNMLYSYIVVEMARLK